MQEVYIIEPLRTPVGRYGGALSSIRPDDLGAHVISSCAIHRHQSGSNR